MSGWGTLCILLPVAAALGCASKEELETQRKLAVQYRKEAKRERRIAEEYRKENRFLRAILQSSGNRGARAVRARLEQTLTARFRKLIADRMLCIRLVNDRVVLELRSAILFHAGTDHLKPEGARALDEVAEGLKRLPDRHFQVGGHTDDHPIRRSQFKSTWALSIARSVRVVQYLQKKGVSPGSLSAGGFGEFQPVSENATAVGRRLNRRIEITLLPVTRKSSLMM